MSNSYVFNRQIKDANKVVTKAYPAAAANNNSPTIDLGAGSFKPEELEFELSVPALAAHSDTTKNLVLKLQDSADDSSYADVVPTVSVTLAGVASTGTSAIKYRVRLPATIRRYLQVNQAVDSGGPTLTASSGTYSLLF